MSRLAEFLIYGSIIGGALISFLTTVYELFLKKEPDHISPEIPSSVPAAASEVDASTSDAAST